MSKKDPQYIPKLEKAIAQKYGEEATHNPRRFWDEEKEQDYLIQSQEEQKKFDKLEQTTAKVETDGFLINKKLLNRDTNRVCSVCDHYSFNVRDNLYLNKYECCSRCYVRWIEDREERWLTGWRPEKEN